MGLQFDLTVERKLTLTPNRGTVSLKPLVQSLTPDLIEARDDAEAAAAAAAASQAAATTAETNAETAETNAEAAQAAAEAAQAAAEAVPTSNDGIVSALIDNVSSDTRASLDVLLDALTAADVGAATPADVTAAIAAVIDSAPGALDTLNELAAALGDDPNFATTMTNALAAKAPLASPTFTGTVSGITKAMVGLGNVANVDQQNASNLTSGTVATARLGSGTADSATYLRGDNTWATIAAGGGLLASLAYTAAAKSTTATTMTDIDATNLAITFTAPASGTVIVRCSGPHRMSASSSGGRWGLRNGSTTVGDCSATPSAANSSAYLSIPFRVTGLTGGASVTLKWAWLTTTGTVNLDISATAPAVMEVLSA
jgi:hypothetical protein